MPCLGQLLRWHRPEVGILPHGDEPPRGWKPRPSGIEDRVQSEIVERDASSKEQLTDLVTVPMLPSRHWTGVSQLLSIPNVWTIMTRKCIMRSSWRNSSSPPLSGAYELRYEMRQCFLVEQFSWSCGCHLAHLWHSIMKFEEMECDAPLNSGGSPTVRSFDDGLSKYLVKAG